jgi:hypothetical protein
LLLSVLLTGIAIGPHGLGLIARADRVSGIAGIGVVLLFAIWLVLPLSPAQRFDAKLQQGLAEVRAELRTEMAYLRAELIKWMFLVWLGTVGVTLAGVLLR